MSRNLYTQHYANSPEQVTLKFRFQSAGAATNAPDFIVPASCGVDSITHASTGVYAIQFSEKFPVFLGMVATVLEATEVNDYVIKCGVGDYDTATGILTVTCVGLDGSVAAEAVVDNDWVYMEVTFCRRSAMAPTGAI